MRTDDWSLLCQYARRRSDEAFATLVNRHLNLVYSVALRQVRSPHLAQEVAQSVFSDLARNAGTLKPDTVLTAWLYRVTYRTAIDVVRHESRRQAREQIAMEMAAMNTASSEWTHIEPLLDEAMETLDEQDRTAILLRYFDNKSLRDVGEALGISEDATQKRVSRAMERLRESLSKCGVVVGAAVLIVVISANAVQAAPAGLAATISVAASLVGTTTIAATTATITKAIAMTALQKLLVTATLLATVGAGIYEARQASILRDRVQTLQQQQTRLRQQIQRNELERDDAVDHLSAIGKKLQGAAEDSNELLRLRAEMARLRDEADTAASDLKQARDFQSLVMQIYSNTPPISTLVSTTTITTSWDQGIVVGGWKTPSGKRVIVLVRLQPAGGPEHVSIESTTVEYTEEAGATTGLTQFNVDGLYTTKAHKLTAERMEAILRSAKDGNDGINIVATPIAQTVSEQEAEISVEGMGQTSSGEKSPARQVLDIVPTVAADGQSVHIVMTALLNYPIDLPPIETH